MVVNAVLGLAERRLVDPTLVRLRAQGEAWSREQRGPPWQVFEPVDYRAESDSHLAQVRHIDLQIEDKRAGNGKETFPTSGLFNINILPKSLLERRDRFSRPCLSLSSVLYQVCLLTALCTGKFRCRGWCFGGRSMGSKRVGDSR